MAGDTMQPLTLIWNPMYSGTPVKVWSS